MGDDKCSVRPWCRKYPAKKYVPLQLSSHGLPTICQLRWNRAKCVWKLWTETMECRNIVCGSVVECECIVSVWQSTRAPQTMRRAYIAHGKTKTFAPFHWKNWTPNNAVQHFLTEFSLLFRIVFLFFFPYGCHHSASVLFSPFFSIYISAACFWNQGNQRERHCTLHAEPSVYGFLAVFLPSSFFWEVVRHVSELERAFSIFFFLHSVKIRWTKALVTEQSEKKNVYAKVKDFEVKTMRSSVASAVRCKHPAVK